MFLAHAIRFRHVARIEHPFRSVSRAPLLDVPRMPFARMSEKQACELRSYFASTCSKHLLPPLLGHIRTHASTHREVQSTASEADRVETLRCKGRAKSVPAASRTLSAVVAPISTPMLPLHDIHRDTFVKVTVSRLDVARVRIHVQDIWMSTDVGRIRTNQGSYSFTERKDQSSSEITSRRGS